MPLQPGDKLGPYEILARIGAGGMGEVYKARDTRLGRDVAVKVSNESFNDRFEREAKSIAALNHPNVCQLYDVGADYLVMELIDGEPIKGPLPLETALDYARQIADALNAAHDKGIVHRDLKPANIMLTSSGVIKVLDFGLAKPAEATESDPENSPTMTISPTRAGMIIGTAAYMAPEQARGKSVDKRTDIWAFGVVLYEILAGKKLFPGETVSDILVSVLKEDPDLSRIPVEARRLVRSCLQKDPRRRLRDIGDMSLLLDHAEAPARKSGLAHWAWPAIAAVATALAAILFFLRAPPGGSMPVAFQISAPENAQFGPQMALSPDGRMLAFTARSPVEGAETIWVRPLDGLQARPLRQAHTSQPFFWSSDSRFIAYNPGDNKLTKIDVSGGTPQVLCDAPQGVIGGFWTKDGTIVFGQNSGPLMTVAASGGVPTPLAKVDSSEFGGGLLMPSLLPDGRHIAYFKGLATQTDHGYYVTSFGARAGNDKLLLDSPAAPAFAPSADSASGYLLYLRDTTLLAQPIDLGTLAMTGTAVAIAEGVGSWLAHSFVSASNNGLLAYRTGAGAGERLAWFDRSGKETSTASPAGEYRALALSPDGSRVAVSRVEGSNLDIWLVDLARNTSTRLTSDPAGDFSPVWSRDGSRVAWASGTSNRRSLFVTLAGADAKPRKLLPVTLGLTPWDWSSDERLLLYSDVDLKSANLRLWTIGVDGDPKPSRVTGTDFNESQAQFSPDARWISYTSDESGRNEIYVRPFPASPEKGGKVKVSEGGGDHARWRRDGHELFYIANDSKIMAVDVGTAAGFKAGVPQQLFQARLRAGEDFRWDVSADGNRFLIATPVANAADAITILVNWQAALKK